MRSKRNQSSDIEAFSAGRGQPSPHAPSFYDVLEDQIRAELRAEIQDEFERETKAGRADSDPNSARAGAFEAWMAAHTEKIVFTGKRARDVYGAPQRPARSKSRPHLHVARKLTLEEWTALELVNRYSGGCLTELYSEQELKAAWRKAAFRTHPDRASANDPAAQMQAARLFQDVRRAFKILEATLTAPDAYAA